MSMLLNLTIKNFAIVSYVEVDWQKGMTTITGETGAGKSIAIDALGLCLGERALTNTVRPGSDKAELCANFDVTDNKSARQWLDAHDLQNDDECIIRRVISSEGRSRAYINGNSVPLNQLKTLGEKLINIHGQHDHQLLLKSTEQRRLLDAYANHQPMLAKLQSAQKQWRHLNNELATLQQQKQQRQAEQQLLHYQVQELDEFNIQDGEFTQLENDFKRHANAQKLMILSEQSLQTLANDEQVNAISALQQSLDSLSQLSEIDSNAKAIASLVEEAKISLEEACNDLNHYQQGIEINPEQYTLIEERYSTAINLARKHHIEPENLLEHHKGLAAQLASIANDDMRLEHIDNELQDCLHQYQQLATKLSASRQKQAKLLAQKISSAMHELNMPDAKFELQLTTNESSEPAMYGLDNIEFVVAMNPGQSLESMAKVASGGELSRISLAIQVILAEKVDTPVLIFDEVDVGISGPTAAKVGQQLQRLGQNTQVICVTHLPQVAAKGDQQLFVSKLIDGKQTQTQVSHLSAVAREKEVARLLAGDQISQSSLANAKELLAKTA